MHLYIMKETTFKPQLNKVVPYQNNGERCFPANIDWRQLLEYYLGCPQSLYQVQS